MYKVGLTGSVKKRYFENDGKEKEHKCIEMLAVRYWSGSFIEWRLDCKGIKWSKGCKACQDDTNVVLDEFQVTGAQKVF